MGEVQGSGVDAVGCHAWPGVPVGEWQAHSWAPRAGRSMHVWVNMYRGMAGAGRGKHKISTKEVPPWNGRRVALLGAKAGLAVNPPRPWFGCGSISFSGQ